MKLLENYDQGVRKSPFPKSNQDKNLAK